MKRRISLMALLVVGSALTFLLLSGFLSRAKGAAEWARQKGSQSASLSFFMPMAKRFLGKAQAGTFTSVDGRRAVEMFCQPILDEAWKSVDASQQYENRELREFNRIFRWLNRAVPARSESTLCHLRRGLGVESFDELPFHKATRYHDKNVDIEINVPTEGWALESGYEVKAVVRVEQAISLVLYWSGKNGHSRGFLIEGTNGLYAESRKQTGYLWWDRSDVEQIVKYYGAEFENAYLENVGGHGAPGDKAIYGEIRYNRITSAFHLQSTVMEPQNRKGEHSFGCYRWHARGTKGDLVLIAQTGEDRWENGHGRNTSFRDATEMDAFWLRDEKTSPAWTGKLDSTLFADWVAPGIEQYPFRKTCNDLYAAGVGDGAFAETDNNARFDAAPDDVFSLQAERHHF